MIVGSRHQPLPAPRRGFFERIGLVRRVAQASLMPRGYGIAWHAWYAAEAVAMPIPLNLAAGAVRSAWLWAKQGGSLNARNTREAYEAGRKDERREWTRWAQVDRG